MAAPLDAAAMARAIATAMAGVGIGGGGGGVAQADLPYHQRGVAPGNAEVPVGVATADPCAAAFTLPMWAGGIHAAVPARPGYMPAAVGAVDQGAMALVMATRRAPRVVPTADYVVMYEKIRGMIQVENMNAVIGGAGILAFPNQLAHLNGNYTSGPVPVAADVQAMENTIGFTNITRIIYLIAGAAGDFPLILTLGCFGHCLGGMLIRLNCRAVEVHEGGAYNGILIIVDHAARTVEDVADLMLEDMFVPHVHLNDSDLTADTTTFHLLQPQDARSFAALVNVFMAGALTRTPLAIYARSIMWTKTFSVLNAPPAAGGAPRAVPNQSSQEGGHQAPPVNPEVPLVLDVPHIGAAAGHVAAVAGGAVVGGGHAPALAGPSVANPGALTLANADIDDTPDGILRRWCLYVKTLPAKARYTAPAGVATGKQNITLALKVILLAYGVNRSSAPDFQLPAYIQQVVGRPSSPFASLARDLRIQGMVSDLATAIREDRAAWDLIMILYSERQVATTHPEHILISWIRTRLIEAGQSNVLSALTETRMLGPLVRAGLLPTISMEINKLNVMFPTGSTNYIGVFGRGLEISEFPNLAFCSLYKNYQAAGLVIGGGGAAQQVVIRRQFLRIKPHIVYNEVLMVLGFSGIAQDAAITQTISAVTDFSCPGVARNHASYVQTYQNIRTTMLAIKDGVAAMER